MTGSLGKNTVPLLRPPLIGAAVQKFGQDSQCIAGVALLTGKLPLDGTGAALGEGRNAGRIRIAFILIGELNDRIFLPGGSQGLCVGNIVVLLCQRPASRKQRKLPLSSVLFSCTTSVSWAS